MDKPKHWVKINPEKVNLPLTIHEDYAEGKSYDDGYYSGFLEGHKEAVGKKDKIQEKHERPYMAVLPDWLYCLTPEWDNLMKRLDIYFDPIQKKYNWTHPIWAAKFVIHLMVQSGHTRNKPKQAECFDDLFFKINRKGMPMTSQELKAALKSGPNDFKGKTEYPLYKLVKLAVADVFLPISSKADIKKR